VISLSGWHFSDLLSSFRIKSENPRSSNTFLSTSVAKDDLIKLSGLIGFYRLLRKLYFYFKSIPQEAELYISLNFLFLNVNCFDDRELENDVSKFKSLKYLIF